VKSAMVELRAMNQEIEKALQLQRIDMQKSELEKEIATLPKHIAAIEQQLVAHQRQLEANRATLAANQKDRRGQETDIQAHQQKISKLRDQMMAAKNNEQYRAFQHEITFCEESIAKCEDRILVLMEQTEQLEGNVKAAEAALAKEKVHVDGEKDAARKRTAEDQAKLKQLFAERTEVQTALPAPLYAAYERIRKRTAIVVAEASGGRCQACQLELRPQVMQEVRKGDGIFYCENCRRMLYYNPTVAFDPATGPGPAANDGKRVDMT
jgi:predicted  nucleic acid-binding Zn-ribbon protein